MNYDFPNIEVADIEKKINLKQKAETDGRNNIPPTNSIVPEPLISEVEIPAILLPGLKIEITSEFVVVVIPNSTLLGMEVRAFSSIVGI